MMRSALLLLSVLVAVPLSRGGEPPRIVRHVDVYNEKGRFAGWPANQGAWSWGDEFLVAFSRGFFREGSPDDYHLDRTKPEDLLFARSRDGGETWSFLAAPAPDTGDGNPPCLNALPDGRLCLTYGHRAAPYPILGRLSSDHGMNWSLPVIVRGDGDSHDTGYPRSFVRSDGKVVTVYAFHGPSTPGATTLDATIWDPGTP